ncbi:hypothetical protein A3H16_01565 [Candidatus Kaiserbacteria bacterium RIFCSPLOWO2_12_FULL_53_8]|uniref:Uncharacterized protein n=2 Tax=Candidatus Kaiseribacteriota TaxID=1752734 RepID=A0A1F6CW25_9BACT|nr:MAG: hypothetical protein A2851_00150 [Candidatus Kaiserbacteria bacterium RIFCSPHIGHO2_01_FULL_53_29]OGG91097.1 MAG: hypothetical protein A3H16_01565 [Candidatus Kaiserbacteria bacterium RIFCSPLOWO2_12_FULL_53_8]
MNVERAILVAFLGNYLINTVVAAVVALVPASTGGGVLTPQYISFVVLAIIVVGILAWWYMSHGNSNLKGGAMFGALGFVVAIVTAFVTGVAGVLAQTGSLASVASVLPNFWPFLANWSTLVLLGYWVIPAALVGWYLQQKSAPMSSTM